jgi:nucleolar MIF4G domain-containing protein 1
MSRGPIRASRASRKEERKNARLAKKQRKSLHHQKLIDTRKGLSPSLPSAKKALTKPVASKTKTGKPQKKKISMSDVDEEISSDFDLNEIEEEAPKKLKKKSKSSKNNKKPSESETEDNGEGEGDEDDFLSIMDKAFASGKLTKNGLLGKNGKIESGKFVSSDDDEGAEDFDVDDDFLIESVDEESSEESEKESVKEAAPTNIHSMLPKFTPQVQANVVQTQTIENIKLLRQIQSLVNKLGSSNLVPICNEFEGIFRENRRKEVIELLTDTIISSIVRPGGNLLDSFALNFAALAFIINHMVGIEFGAYLIEKLIETIDSLYIQSKSFIAQSPADDTNIHERSLVNCMNFCSFLYDLQVISSNLICDLIRQSAQRLDEIDVEIILKLFKTCGQQIKRDDADFMKFISSEISKNSLEFGKEKQSSRFKFMIETINDLKDSKRKLASAMTVELEPVKKMLKNFLSQKLIAKIEPLRISLDDIRNIESKGKWWLVGSSWHPQNAGTNSEIKSSTTTRNDELAKLEKLAKAQRMNTEIRKSIFSTIVSSDDYSDAFERLLAMKLTGKQEREIILVLIHCCGQEKVFNPFYAFLAGKFASYRQGFKVTLQYTLWDCFKQLKGYPLRKLANISKLYGTLVAQEDLPLSVLRKGNFIRLSDEERIFWQLLFMTLFTKVPSDDELTNITQNLVSSIETGISDNPTASTKNKSSKIVSLTENIDMAEFDDDFFAAQDKILNTRGMSPDKLEECKNLRNGMIYFLDLYFIKTNDFPFSNGIEICKKRAKRMKQILSN